MFGKLARAVATVARNALKIGLKLAVQDLVRKKLGRPEATITARGLDHPVYFRPRTSEPSGWRPIFRSILDFIVDAAANAGYARRAFKASIQARIGLRLAKYHLLLHAEPNRGRYLQFLG